MEQSYRIQDRCLADGAAGGRWMAGGRQGAEEREEASWVLTQSVGWVIWLGTALWMKQNGEGHLQRGLCGVWESRRRYADCHMMSTSHSVNEISTKGGKQQQGHMESMNGLLFTSESSSAATIYSGIGMGRFEIEMVWKPWEQLYYIVTTSNACISR